MVLAVSRGPAEVEVPDDLAGRSEEDVRDALEAAGLEAGATRTANSPWVPQGMLVATDPAGGTTVPSGSEVQLVLSTGRVTVPQLVGLSRQEAVAALGADAVRLSSEVVTTPRAGVPAGQVVDQSVDAGQSAPQGSTITLTVAVAPEPEPAPEPSPSPTPSPSPEATEDEEEPEETAAPEEESEPSSTPDDSAETSPEDSPETEARDDDEQDGIPQQAADRAREALEQGADRGPRRD